MTEIKKYNQIERPIQDELDRIDSELHDVSVATDDGGVHIPFGRIMPGGGGLDLSKVSFGYKINPDGDNTAEVVIYTGTINRNASTKTKLTLAITGTNEVYARVTKATPATILITQAASVPAEDATYNYYRLYQFTLTDGVIVDSSTKPYRPFDIETTMGFTGTVTTVGAMQFSANALQYKVKSAIYANGLLTAEPTLGDWVTLFTASTGCPA